MIIKRKFEGELHALEGHDNTVTSRKLFNPDTGCTRMDFHVTTFAPGADMDIEIHEFSDHVFYMVSGTLGILVNGERVDILEAGDSIYIPAGDPHQLRNYGTTISVFLAVTVPPCN